MNLHTAKALVASLLLVSIVAAEASGTYCATCLPRPPRANAQEKSLNREMFDLGQRIYLGAVPAVVAGTDADAQRTRLKQTQASLPERVQKKKDIGELAGRLTGPHLDALIYYLTERYNLKK